MVLGSHIVIALGDRQYPWWSGLGISGTCWCYCGSCIVARSLLRERFLKYCRCYYIVDWRLPQWRHQIPEAGLGDNVFWCKDSHVVVEGWWVAFGNEQAKPHCLVLLQCAWGFHGILSILATAHKRAYSFHQIWKISAISSSNICYLPILSGMPTTLYLTIWSCPMVHWCCV